MKTRNPTMTLLLLALLAPGGAVQAGGDANPETSAAERIVAVGDVHGEFDKLVDVLQHAGVLDGDLAWAGGATRLVVVGDSVDRGPDSRRVLDLWMRLEGEAAAEGGSLHVLLGNHEAMWLTGDFEYASAGDFAAFTPDESADLRRAARERFEQLREAGQVQGDFDDHFPPGALALRHAMSPEGEYGRWLMGRPVAAVVDGVAFVHGGISDSYAGKSTEDINERSERVLESLLRAWDTLAEAGIVAPEYPLLNAARGLKPHVESGAFDRHPTAIRQAASELAAAPESLLFDPAGPLWYRGNATCNEVIETGVVARALEGLGADSMVISHTPVAGGTVTARLDGRVTRLDVGADVAALIITSNDREVFYSGQPDPRPVKNSGSHPVASVDMDASGLEDFLASAEVVAGEEVGAGVTRPKRLTLEKDGVRVRAIFKTEATETRATGRLQAQRLVNLSDRWQHDVAAYRLDRMLGMDMVPVTVKRRVNGETGALQYWVENGTNERERRKRGLDPDPPCPFEPQYDALELFDRLIYNTDRTQENILYTRDWRIALIDHSRSFRTHRSKPEAVRHVDPTDVPELARRIAELDTSFLKAELGNLLSDAQIRALAARRDEIVAEWRGRD